MLIDGKGVNLAAFEPVLAAVLGNTKGEEGYKVISEASHFGHERIELRDWLYCLVKGPGMKLRKFLVEGPGKTADELVDLLESSLGDEDASGVTPSELTPETVTAPVMEMLKRAEEIARAGQKGRVDDDALSLALLETADADLMRLLGMWSTEERLKGFLRDLKPKVISPLPPVLFLENGELNRSVFTGGGWRFCQRMREELAALGAEKVTSRHLLYSILGNEEGALAVSLSMQNVDVKKDLHAALTRELARPGRKRNDELKLNRNTLFASVTAILSEALGLAAERGAKELGEQDIHRAFVTAQTQELTRLIPKEKTIDLAALREYLRDFTVDESQAGPPIQRYTVQEVQDKINNTIFGQEDAVARVIPWIKRLRFGIPRDGRPAGVFLFLGPTGAGKTQMAKELARYVYGNEDMMIFLEMGQFKSKESMNQFIGAPPGYVGYGEGKLTNGLRDKPESVVLFDEIEKGDTQVFDTLLRFADEGLISDPAGPVRDGRKCIIVMTTNAGQVWLREHLKANKDAIRNPRELTDQLFEAAMKELESKGFRPEFLGRVDERITFLPFSEETCRKIVDSVLDREIGKFLKLKEVAIEVPDRVREVLAQYAFERSGNEGARGAPRAVNEYIVTRAIDKLSDYEEQNKPMPARLIASVEGLTRIVLEEQ
jgi:ATP-dependent Clp protease ATP-binding subunit ClpC